MQQITVCKKELQKAVEVLLPAVTADNAILEQSACILFQNGMMQAYNGELTISYPFPSIQQDFKLALDAETLRKILTRVELDELIFSLEEKELLIISGKSKFGIATQEVSSLVQKVIFPKLWEPLAKNQLAAIYKAASVCESGSAATILSCVSVQENKAIASDNFRILEVCWKEATKIPPFLIPQTVIQYLIKLSVTECAITPAWTHFRTKSGIIFSYRTREGTFPDVSSFLESSKNSVEIIFPEKFIDILNRAEIFSQQSDERIHSIVQFDGKRLIVSSKNQKGWMKETAAFSTSVPPFTFTINPKVLQEALQLNSSVVLSKSKIIIQGKYFRCSICLSTETI